MKLVLGTAEVIGFNSHPRLIINADFQPASTPRIMHSQSCRTVRAA